MEISRLISDLKVVSLSLFLTLTQTLMSSVSTAAPSVDLKGLLSSVARVDRASVKVGGERREEHEKQYEILEEESFLLKISSGSSIRIFTEENTDCRNVSCKCIRGAAEYRP